MTRRNVRIQGWVFPLFSPDSDIQLSQIFTGLLFYIELVIYEVWALDNTLYRKGPMALSYLGLITLFEFQLFESLVNKQKQDFSK